MTWRLQFKPSAQRELDALDRPVAERVRRALLRLAADPYGAHDVKKLAGGHGKLRLRVGDWRVIYTLHAETVVILVVRVAHRSRSYP